MFLRLRKNRRGQVIIEYVLLLVVTSALATILIKSLASRADGDSAGLVVKGWRSLQNEIGKDVIDHCDGSTCKSPP